MSDGTIPAPPEDPGDQFIALALVTFGWPPAVTTNRGSAIYVHEWFAISVGSREHCTEAAAVAISRGWHPYERDGVSYTGRVALVAVRPQ
jgi:hypothetical protein